MKSQAGAQGVNVQPTLFERGVDVENGPNPRAPDYYRRLGLDSSATPAAIKAAYYSAVRQFSPERHPEEFRAIREAYETLHDPESRTQYDTESDPAVKKALEAGLEALQEDRHDEAIRNFRRALVLRPNASYIRALLGEAHHRKGDVREALRQFGRLTHEVPNNASYWVRRGFCEWALDENLLAEKSFEKAIVLDPEDSNGRVGLARSLGDQGRMTAARQSLEEAIRADGVIDFDDFSYLFELVRLAVQAGDRDAIESTANRIEAIIGGEWQRRRAAYRFAQFAQDLLNLRGYELALALAEKSVRLLPNDPNIAYLTGRIRHEKNVIEQWRRFQEDTAVRQTFQFYIAVLLRGYFEQWATDAERRQEEAKAADLLNSETTVPELQSNGYRWLSAELSYVKSTYPLLAMLIPDAVQTQIRSAKTATYVRVTCPHCGDAGKAKPVTARLECPACKKPFDFDASAREVTKHSKAVQRGRTWETLVANGGTIAFWIFMAALYAMCSAAG